jgi:signal transduction histidine kinase
VKSFIPVFEENIAKLFKITEKFSMQGTEQEEGTGLGLILSKEFIDLHNGEIMVESQIGKGSTFTFTLPL